MNYLPDIYKNFQNQFPELARDYEALAEKCYNWGTLDEKTKRFFKLGVAIGLASEGGVRSHVRRALEEGASRDEVRHAVLLSLTTIGFPAMIAATKWAEEVIAKHK